MNFRFDRDPISHKEEDEIKERYNAEIKIGKKKAEIIGKLVFFTDYNKNYNNHLDFHGKEGEGYGLDDESELIKNTNINKKVFEGLENDERKKKDILYAVNVFKSFLKGPIFTDTFHKKHRDIFKVDEEHAYRYDWELENINLEKIDKDTIDYYKSNRLNANKCFQAAGFLAILADLVVDVETKKELLNYKEEVPQELYKVEEDGTLAYNFFNDEKKVKIVQELSEIIKKALNLLTEKQVEE